MNQFNAILNDHFGGLYNFVDGQSGSVLHFRRHILFLSMNSRYDTVTQRGCNTLHTGTIRVHSRVQGMNFVDGGWFALLRRHHRWLGQVRDLDAVGGDVCKWRWYVVGVMSHDDGYRIISGISVCHFREGLPRHRGRCCFGGGATMIGSTERQFQPVHAKSIPTFGFT